MTITNDVLIRDIENTKRECKAYRLILEGYYILNGFPESNFRADILKFESNLRECSHLLDQLQALYDERMRNE